ncbi:MAG: TonB-dependent receptor [Candidatus Marinimicrobia bacterium]|nr:TonB-dependent receptor [Candidatus Neomarinimicrobiota bacterium]
MYSKFQHFILKILLSMAVLTPQGDPPSETNDIQGYVKDKTTRETLPYANIWLIGTDRGTSSNTDGYFVIVNAPVGVCSLQVSYIGYETQVIEVINDPSSEQSLVIEINPKLIGMDQVDVVGEAYDIFKSSDNVSQMTLSPRQLQFLPSLGEVDIFRSLQLLPGISGVGDGKTGLYVRGGTPDQNMVILDGMIVYHVDHFFGMFSVFNADAIKDVQVYKGGFPAKYGGRLSSVVELTGKRGGDIRQMSFGANLLSANFSYETPLWNDRGSWLISARRSFTDILQSPLYNSMYEFVTGEESTTGTTMPGQGGGMRGGAFQQEIIPSFFFYDLNSKLSLNPTSRDFLSLSFYSGRDYLDKSRELNLEGRGFTTSNGSEFQTRNDENVTDWGNLGASFKWGHQWSSRGFTNLLISSSSYTSNYERELSVGGANVAGVDTSTGAVRGLGGFAQDEFNTVNDQTFRLDNQWQFNDNHKLEFGTSISNIGTDYTATILDTISILDIYSKSLSTAVYVQDQWKPSSLFDLTFGLRSTYYDQTGKIYNAPRLSFGVNFSKNLRLKGAWGHYYQFINNITNENVLQGSKDFWLSSDNNLLPGFSQHFILGLSYDYPTYLFEVEGYYKSLENLLEFSRRFQDRADYMNYFFLGSGIAKGVEFLAQKKFGSLTGWVNYTLSQVEHTFPNLNDGQLFPANHDRRHEFKAVGTYKWGPWSLSSTFVYSTGNPYTAPESQYFLEMLDGESLSYIHVGEKNAYRLPDYQRLDFSVLRTFLQYSDFSWDIGFSIYNVLNHSNVSYRDYDLDVVPIIVSDIKMLGFTPTLFIKANLK